ncbi:MAG: carboxypeptidase-like regulatory domain-containing protein, partial [Paramuribaculum sp.]|nr:carboxypeptidase-like regulatory domain-containing protein [Paramuribaculum sp.]
MKTHIVLLLIAFSAICCEAHNRISGYVMSNSLDSLDFAIVRVLGPDSALVAHATTDSIGHYDIRGINIETGFIHVSSFGYEPELRAIRFSDNDLILDFRLAPKSQQLNEIVVNGSRITKTSDGHITALPTKEEKRHSFGGIDLLANMMIPGVSVERSSG